MTNEDRHRRRLRGERNARTSTWYVVDSFISEECRDAISENVGGSRRSVGHLGVAMIVYFNVCGGPWGSEQIIASGGPLIGLIGIIVFACFLAIPSIMMTTELSSMFPTNGGYSIWVKEALGSFWGFQESWWSWGSGVVDNALYPVLFFEILCGLSGTIASLGKLNAYLFKVGLLIVFSIPNFLFVDVVGRWLGLLLVFTTLPFVAFIASALISDAVSLDPAQLLRAKDLGDVDWATLMSVLYWNFSGFDCISTISGEVETPAKTIWKGSLLGWVLMVVMYVVPLLIATCVNIPSWDTWDEGSLDSVARTVENDVGGHHGWLTGWLTVASAAAFVGQFSAELMEDSFQIMGVSEQGMLPKIFTWKHPRFGTPWVASVLQMVIVAMLLIFDFNFIVIIDNSFSILSFLLEILSLLVLRSKMPTHADRPFRNVRMFSSFAGAACLMVPPVVVAMAVFCIQLTSEKWWIALLVDGLYLLFGFGLGRVYASREASSVKSPTPASPVIEVEDGAGTYALLGDEEEGK